MTMAIDMKASELKKLALIALLAIATWGSAAMAATDVVLERAHIDLKDTASLQNGARLYVNYCMGCHSLEYMRYNRIATDLKLSDEQLEQFLLVGNAKPGDHMTIAMQADDAEQWLGAPPPDLSLVARRKPGGADWTYNFLRSFYADQDSLTGWNNAVLPNASMPNVLWQLQGIQQLKHDDGHADAATEAGGGHGGAEGGAHGAKPSPYELVQQGSMSPAEFDLAARDLAAFLDYVGEPAKLKRTKLGIWVLLYVTLFTTVAYFLKKEFWNDIH